MVDQKRTMPSLKSIKNKRYLCHICGRLFATNQSLERHIGVVHNYQEKVRYLCNVCGQVFLWKQNLNSHLLTHSTKKFNCTSCFRSFPSRKLLLAHIRTMHKVNKKYLKVISKTSSLGGAVIKYYIRARGLQRENLQTCQSGQFNIILKLLRHEVSKHKNSKFNLSAKVSFYKLNEESGQQEFIDANFNSTSLHINASMSDEELSENIYIAFNEQSESCDNYLELSSSYSIDQVGGNFLNIIKDSGFRGSGPIKLPEKLQKSHFIINMETDGTDQCFLYALYCLVCPVKRNRHRLSHYRNLTSIRVPPDVTFPCGLSDIKKFEKWNESIAISVYYFNSEQGGIVTPLSISPHRDVRKHDTNLLLLYSPESDGYHFLPITNLDSFLSFNSGDNFKKYCRKCLCGYTYQAGIDRHMKNCTASQKVEMPPESQRYIEFQDQVHTALAPAFMTADIECKMVPEGKDLTRHEMISFAIFVVIHPRYKSYFPEQVPFFYSSQI